MSYGILVANSALVLVGCVCTLLGMWMAFRFIEPPKLTSTSTERSLGNEAKKKQHNKLKSEILSDFIPQPLEPITTKKQREVISRGKP